MTDLGADARLLMATQASKQATGCTGCTFEAEIGHSLEGKDSFAAQIGSRSNANDESLYVDEELAWHRKLIYERSVLPLG